MKKLEKLKGKKPIVYKIDLKNKDYLEDLKKNKYLIFKYQKGDKFLWKFIKTEKIVEILPAGEYYNMVTNMDGKEFLMENDFYVTKEFTLAKVMCDEGNGTRKFY